MAKFRNHRTWNHQILYGQPYQPTLKPRRIWLHQLLPVGIYRSSKNYQNAASDGFESNLVARHFCLAQPIGVLLVNDTTIMPMYSSPALSVCSWRESLSPNSTLAFMLTMPCLLVPSYLRWCCLSKCKNFLRPNLIEWVDEWSSRGKCNLHPKFY